MQSGLTTALLPSLVPLFTTFQWGLTKYIKARLKKKKMDPSMNIKDASKICQTSTATSITLKSLPRTFKPKTLTQNSKSWILTTKKLTKRWLRSKNWSLPTLKKERTLLSESTSQVMAEWLTINKPLFLMTSMSSPVRLKLDTQSLFIQLRKCLEEIWHLMAKGALAWWCLIAAPLT